ncbi:hypothetical protein, partial [Streptomyces sp. NPDC057910]|uniref:hypothetical protein n=1 Tax=Streptomyces sp. NPDC057910 TaxID=3346278 RepID=UPI0036E4BCC2
WENTTTPYTHLRVTNGTHTTDINLTTLTPPTPITDSISGVAMTSQTVIAVPRNNALDQAPMDVQIKSSSSTEPDFDGSHEAYQRLHYRFKNADGTTGALITGLLDPKKPNQYTAVTHMAGAYPNTGIQTATPPRHRVYLTTTSAAVHSVQAVLSNGGTPNRSSDVKVDPKESSKSTAGREGSAIRVNGECIEGPCLIAKPTDNKPVPFSNGTDIGLQLRTAAITSTESLPVPAPGSRVLPAGGKLGRSGLNIDNVIARLENPGAFNRDYRDGSAEKFATFLVSHGDLVQADGIPVP